MFSWYEKKLMGRKEEDKPESQQGPEPYVFRPMSKTLQKIYRESVLNQIECLCAKDPELKEAIFHRFAKRNPNYYLFKQRPRSPTREMLDEKRGPLSRCLPDSGNKERKMQMSNLAKNGEEVSSNSNATVLPPLRISNQSPLPKPPSPQGQSTSSSVSGGRFKNVARHFLRRDTTEEEVKRNCSPIIEEPELPFKNPVPPSSKPANPQAQRRAFSIPVLDAGSSGNKKELGGGYQLQTAQAQVEKMDSKWTRFKHHLFNRPPKVSRIRRWKPTPARARATTRAPPPLFKAPVRTRPLNPTLAREVSTQTEDSYFTPRPPTTPPPRMQRQNLRASRIKMPKPDPTEELCSPQEGPSSSPPPEPAPAKNPCPEKVRVSRSQRQTDALNNLAELHPFYYPEAELTKCLDLMQDKDWDKKIAGLKIVQALAQHHQADLKLRLHDVCSAVIEEVKNTRSAVATAAIESLVYIALYFKEDMDIHAEKMGRALLLKIAQSSGNVFMQKRASSALQVVVQCCSPRAVMNALVNTGLNHLSPAVKASAAQQLHLLSDELELPGLLAHGKTFTQTFLCAVNKMALDSAAGVREHGLATLKDLAIQQGFRRHWENTVTHQDRPYLDKILAKMERN